jgi:uncharacterized protein
MKTKVQSTRIKLFIILTFGASWALDLVIYLTGGLNNLVIGSRSWYFLMLSMFTPALAAILTRLLSREGWQNTLLKPHFKSSFRDWLIAWFVFPVLLLLGMALYFLLFPQFLDRSLTVFSKALSQTSQRLGSSLALTPRLLMIIQAVQAILIGPILNGIPALGEEFGWRAYLLQKYLPLGPRKAAVIVGLIWGVWHWPVITMGYEYGLDYPGYPWLGPVVFLWFTMAVGILLAWLTLRSQSVWPAVVAHAGLNALAPLAVGLTLGKPNTLLGPGAVGLIGSLPFAVLALVVLWRSKYLRKLSNGQTESSDALGFPIKGQPGGIVGSAS